MKGKRSVPLGEYCQASCVSLPIRRREVGEGSIANEH